MKDKTIFSYEKVHNLALEYKDTRSEKSAEGLIKCFDVYMKSYANYLKGRQKEYSNRGVLLFVKTFMSKKVVFTHSNVIKKNLYEEHNTHENKLISNIFKKIEYDEIYNECICALLKLASRYNDTRPSFHNYVSKVFPYELYRCFSKYTKDICNNIDPVDDNYISIENVEYKNLSENILNELDKQYNVKKNFGLKHDNYSIYDDKNLNENWLNGITSSQIFNTLNYFEKNVIIDRYLNNESDKEIAIKYGMSSTSIWSTRRKAINKIEMEMALDGMIKCDNLLDKLICDKHVKNVTNHNLSDFEIKIIKEALEYKDISILNTNRHYTLLLSEIIEHKIKEYDTKYIIENSILSIIDKIIDLNHSSSFMLMYNIINKKI